jgi:hypothetical protein
MKDNEFKWLKRWFVVHFVIDIVVAVPLMLVPGKVLGILGIDGGVSLARVVSAALLGIGGESWFGRNNSKKGYIGMLRLKIIWSSMAVLALSWGVVDKELSLLVGASLAGVFIVFNILWTYWFLRLRK